MKTSAIALITLTLTLGICSSLNDDDGNEPVNDGTTIPPTAPANLVGVHYPGSGFELGYDAAVDSVAVPGYDVSRAGTPSSCDGSCCDTTYTYYACEAAGTTRLGRILKSRDYSGSSRSFDELSIVMEYEAAMTLSGTMAIA